MGPDASISFGFQKICFSSKDKIEQSNFGVFLGTKDNHYDIINLDELQSEFS